MRIQKNFFVIKIDFMGNFLLRKSLKAKGKILAAGIFVFGLYLSSVFVSQCKKESSKSPPPTQVGGLPVISDKDIVKAPKLDEAISEVSPPQSISIRVLKKEDIKELNPIPPEYGGAFKAKEGDILVETEKIRAIIQRPSKEIREIGVSTYAGNIIDVDIKREDGKFHDILGEENWFWFLGHTIKPQKIGVLEGKQNVIVVLGELDLLDYINANGLAGTVFKRFIPNYELPFKVDEVKPLKVAKYFVFSDGRYIKIIDVACSTSEEPIEKFFFADIIDSGGSGEFFIPSSDLQGFGYVSPLPTGLSVFRMSSFAFVSEEVDSSYGIFHFKDGNFTDDNVVLVVSGVALLGYGMLDGDPLNSLLQVAMGTSSRFIEIKPKECIMNQKYFVVGNGSPSSLSDEFFRIRQKREKFNLYEVQGKVNVDNLPYLPSRPRVAVFKGNELITTAIADQRGNFKLLLPEGEYKFIAELKELPPSQPKIVKVPEQLKVSFDLGSVAKVIVSAVEVYEKDGNIVEKNIPAKVSFLCVGPCPKKICKGKECEVKSTSFRDYVYDPLPEGVQEVVFLAKGERTEVNLPPGTYKIVVSRGMEYSRYEREISLSPGSETEIKAILHKVADTPGWISADTHVHAVNSPDSPVSLIDRVITFAAEGVDVIISTDHDWLTDYEPAIQLVGVSEFLASLVGQEITTFSYGHFNAYPLRRDETKPSDGALDWAEKYDRFQKYGIPESEKEKYRFLRSLHPREIFKNAHLMKPDNLKRNIVQVNHPRSGGMGYFDYVLVDTLNFTTTQDPCMHRIFPPQGQCGTSKEIGGKDTGLFIPFEILADMNNLERFDAIEVYNSYYEIPTVINDWFTFLNHGIHITAVACSDTHQKVQVISGIGRTFAWVGPGNDLPQKFREDVLVQSTFVDSMADGKVFITNGIILDEFKVCGFRGGGEVCAEMGRSNMKNITSGFKVKLKLKSADWVDFDTLRIFINTPKTAVKSGEAKTNLPEPFFVSEITPYISEKNIGGISFKWREFSIDLPIAPPTDDFWVVVMVSCEKKCEPNPMFPVITDKNVKPILITNPIYIDQNGDEKFTPSKPTYADSGISRRAPDFKTKEDVKKLDKKKLKELFIKALETLHIH